LSKIISAKKTNAVFLATVLVAGTIAASTPWFMFEAQAEPYYKMDNDRKSDRNVSVSSLKCNNINVNVNGLSLEVFPPFLSDSGLAAEATEGNTDANSFADNGANGGSEINDFRFICINNNNNTVITEEEELVPPIPPVPLTCEDCWELLSEELQGAVNAFLNAAPDIPLPVDPPQTIPAEVNSIEQLCVFLESLDPPIFVTDTDIDEIITLLIANSGGAITEEDRDELRAVAECLIEAGALGEGIIIWDGNYENY
jgi:hypothetical protein